MQRRQYLSLLSTGMVVALAGCAEEADDNGSDGGDNGDQQHAEIVDHTFIDPERSSAIRFEVSVENTSEEDLELVRVECQAFDEDVRLDDGTASVGDLDAGIQASGDRGLYDLADHIGDVTHYNLTLTYFLAGGNTQYEFDYEFDSFEVIED